MLLFVHLAHSGLYSYQKNQPNDIEARREVIKKKNN
jgi:hypothetical protein